MIRKLVSKPKLLLFGFLVMGAGVMASLANPSLVEAGICYKTLQCDTGYFYGKGAATGTYPSDYWDVLSHGIPSSVTNATTFINFMAGNLKCTSIDKSNSALGVAQSSQDGTGTAFIVLTMLGAPLKTPKNQACVRWTEWKNLVTAYDQAGLVNYNVNIALNDLDTYYMPDFGGDIGFTRGYPPGATIVFYKPDKSGPAYVIRRACANPIGFVDPLPSISNGGNTATGDVNRPAVGDAANGSDPALYSSCNVISGHAFDPAAPNYSVPITVTFSIGGQATANASATGDHGFQVNTPDAVRNSLAPVTVTVTGRSSNNTQFPLANSPITIGPCVVVTGSCVNAVTTPSVVNPNMPYSLRATVQYASAAHATLIVARPDFKFFVQVKRTDGSVLYNNSAVSGVVRSGNQITAELQNLPPTGVGTYNIVWGVTGAYGALQCGGNDDSFSFSALNKPFFSVTGADVSVGAALSPAGATSCPVSGPSARNDSASIVGWSVDPASGDYSGAGTQFAAMALNHIQEFSTVRGNASIPSQPSGLAFANQGLDAGQMNLSSGLYGGKFGGSNCVTDYFAGATAGNTINVSPARLTNLPNFPVGGQVANGSKLTYYINGDLIVNSDVRFTGNYPSLADIPAFAVVVKGNIYIEPGVTRLDGFYIAQASSAADSNGVIYTCAPNGTDVSTILNRELQNRCGGNQLTVNGAFLARQVWLLRASGSLTSTPAEVFNYTPDLWMSSPFSGNASTSNYDAITSLPPIL